MTYFFSCAAEASSAEFNINITLTELAGYLCVDRSAMMRELSRMKADGLIESKGQHIKLLYG
jgi:DNA-binding MarR family transcriptional regulator